MIPFHSPLPLSPTTINHSRTTEPLNLCTVDQFLREYSNIPNLHNFYNSPSSKRERERETFGPWYEERVTTLPIKNWRSKSTSGYPHPFSGVSNYQCKSLDRSSSRSLSMPTLFPISNTKYVCDLLIVQLRQGHSISLLSFTAPGNFS